MPLPPRLGRSAGVCGVRLSPLELAGLSAIFFLTSIVGVVTGTNSLITVPALLLFGVDPRVAVATNMLALTFMSVGGALPFVGKRLFNTRRLPLLIGLTLATSAVGAYLVTLMPGKVLGAAIALLMLAVALFVVVSRRAGVTPKAQAGCGAALAGYLATAALGVYGASSPAATSPC